MPQVQLKVDHCAFLIDAYLYQTEPRPGQEKLRYSEYVKDIISFSNSSPLLQVYTFIKL